MVELSNSIVISIEYIRNVSPVLSAQDISEDETSKKIVPVELAYFRKKTVK